ncbi:MAG: FAD-dependent oxidoreductase [Ramlibacter sp.]|nr:FAD-dependent oxidoreductase [Ramlibacter sp.]
MAGLSIDSSRNAADVEVDVLVAGAGPCGLMLANELGLRGVRCLVVDPKPSTATNPQANATQARTMEHYRRIGIAQEVRALGLPEDHPTDIAYFTRFATHELARLRLPTAAQARAVVQGLSGSWSAAELPHRVSQKFVEVVLRHHAQRLPGNDLRFGWELRAFEDTGEGVRAQIARVGEDALQTVQARFLVGADGARSRVRARLGIEHEGATGLQRGFMGGKMFALYLRAPGFYAALPHDRAWMYVSFNHERRVFMASVDGLGEFAFHAAVHPHETPEDWTHDDARRIFREASGMDIPFEVLSTGLWTAGHSLVASTYQRGRVFIAGDAAHLFTPTGGLGYNTAVGDAVNLGWKLASVVKGVSSPALLDSYDAERRPIGTRNTGYARVFADSIGLMQASPVLEQDTEAAQALRQEAGARLQAHVKREFNIPGVTFGERYDHSPIVLADATPVPPDTANDYVPSKKPGGRLPHTWLGPGDSLYDHLNFEWTVLAGARAGARAKRLAEAGRQAGLDVGLLVLPVSCSVYDDDDLLLVRPDQMVAWREGAAAADPVSLWAAVACLATAR